MNLLRIAIMVAVGVGLGALVGKQGSCSDGTCPLTATAPRGAMWGGLLGLMFAVSLSPGSRSSEAVDLASVEHVISVTTPVDFQEHVLDEPGVSVVYFHADWCGACKSYGPVFVRVAAAQSESAHFYEADTGKAKELSRNHQVEFLPTTLVFVNGKEYDRLVGAASEAALSDAIGRAVNAQALSGSTGEETSNG
jgi:thioredoxin